MKLSRLIQRALDQLYRETDHKRQHELIQLLIMLKTDRIKELETENARLRLINRYHKVA